MSDNISNVTIQTRGRLYTGVRLDDAALHDMIRTQRAFDPAILEAHPPVIFPVEISNNNVDSYFTMMDDSTLQNFADDAEAGVAVQDSHDYRSLPFGHSLTGRFVHEGEVRRVESEFYTVPGLAGRDGKRSDDYILGIQAGIYRDISVGFHLGDSGIIRCNICGEDMMEFWGECTHWPGERYTVPQNPNDPDGSKVEKLAIGIVVNGRLSEYSTVYDGATPGAGVLKAERMIAAGELSAGKARSLEVMYRHKLPDVRQFWAASKESKMGTNIDRSGLPVDEEMVSEDEQLEMPIDQQVPPVDDEHVEEENDDGEPLFDIEEPVEEEDDDENSDDDGARVASTDDDYYNTERARLQDAGIRLKDNPHRVAIALADKVLELRDKVKSLEAEAAYGREYREAMIEDTLREGVRAQGANFDKDRFEMLLRRDSTTLEDIRLMRDTWSAAGDERFGQGRKTRERSRAVPETRNEIEEAAFVDQA